MPFTKNIITEIAATEGGDGAFFHGRKTAVESGSLPYIGNEYARDGEDLQEPG